MIIPVHTPDQIAAVESLAHQIWTEYYTPLIGADQVRYMLDRFQSSEAITDQIHHEGYLYYLLTDNIEDIGYLAVQPRTDELFLSKFYLKKTHRRQGHARPALAFLESLALQLHLPAIRLTVNKHNAQAISAYQALGFRITESIVQEIGGGYVMDDFRMEKRIKEV